MDTWARVVVLVVALAVGITGSVRWEPRIHDRVLRVARDSVGRALATVVAVHVLLVLGVLALAVVIATARALGGTVPAVLGCGIALATVCPVAFAFAPGSGELQVGRGSARADLVARGARPAVARALGWTGAALFVSVSLPTGLVLGILVLVLGRA